MQILELLLASDNGATAQYIHNHELVRSYSQGDILRSGFHRDRLAVHVVVLIELLVTRSLTGLT